MQYIYRDQDSDFDVRNFKNHTNQIEVMTLLTCPVKGNGAMADIIGRSFDPPKAWVDMGKPSDSWNKTTQNDQKEALKTV